ncbi:phosphoinositide 3-kinase regulatory subunit 6 isoform X4 [Channa argus]|uniref:phosphoinositide 3-kinase regulatory subunit 6 isoform X4 n=1 Tax=Channa argus TaxID=215402 RepID=UPI0035226C86
MATSAVDVVPSSAAESQLCRDVRALLKDMNNQRGSLTGRLRWSLEKKVEMDPSCSVSLIKVLLQELRAKLKTPEQARKQNSNMHIIPLLHTLYYVVIQSGSMVRSSLYQHVFECLTNMLILPLPYSAVALGTLRSIKMEMNTPGSLYQRRVMAEQNLKNEHFTSQEKVFVLADPAVFSAPLIKTLRAYLEVSNMVCDTPTMKKNLVLRVLQKGMGVVCQRLVQTLEASGDQMVDKYFQEVVQAMEQSIKLGAGGCEDYLNRLQHIYRDILAAYREELTPTDQSSDCSRPMPFPQISFHLWKEEDDLWNLLVNFTLHDSFGVVDQEKNKRHSDDSGIVGDLKEREAEDAEQPPAPNPAPVITRRNALRSTVDKLRLMKEKMETCPGRTPVLNEDRKCRTARVLVMGDDRVLGRLANAYHSIRERESKRLILTKKLDLKLYYIPVTDEKPSSGSSHCHLSAPPEQNLFLLDNLCYYLRCGTQPVNLPVYRVRMTISSCQLVEEVFVSHLEAEVPEFRHLKQSQEPSARRTRRPKGDVFGAVITVSYTEKSLSKREAVKGEALMTSRVVITSEPAAVITGEDFLTVRFDSLYSGYNTKIQTQNISIKTLEHRTLSVCLDKDSRRTYTNVQNVQISPCLDPGCNIRSRFSFRSERELLLSKYLDKVLSLPINTFSSVTP